MSQESPSFARRRIQIDLSTARALAAGVARVRAATGDRILADNAASPLVTAVTGHLGCEMLDIVVVEEIFRAWEQASLYQGVLAYLGDDDGDWFGIFGPDNSYTNLIDLLMSAYQEGKYQLGKPEYATVAVGPDATMQVIHLGLVPAHAPDGTPVVIGLRRDLAYGGTPTRCILNVLSADQAAAAATRDEINRMQHLHDVMRGQALSFGFSEHNDNELVTFLPRVRLDASEVILPDGVLETIERHVVGIGEHAAELLAAGQHLKRGLLLHGPPGTGKTHTVRYLIGRMPDSTAILVTGQAIKYLDFIVALARRLPPSIIVIEDVDLVAEDRSAASSSPLLFSLLEAMDGLAADVDITFVLTTNRADVLEEALASRPGRVDLAVEVPRPDAAGRERLLRLYARNLLVKADLTPIVAGTEGVTASYVKELMRRVVLVALRTGEDLTALTDEHFGTALAEMRDQRQDLTRAILGGPTRPGRGGDRYDPSCD